MNSIKLISLIIGLLLCSCTQQHSFTAQYGKPLCILKFDFEKDNKGYNDFLNLIDSIKVVKLKTNKDFVVGAVTKVLCDKEYIYILDKLSKALFKYTKTGECVLKISNIGKGPGEFLHPSDFCLVNDQIVLLDISSGKMIFYNKTGKFLKELSKRITADNFGRIDTNHFCMLINKKLMPSNHNIIVVDQNGKTTNELMETPSFLKNKNLSLWKPIHYFGEELLYTDAFSNNIFKVSKDAVFIKYRLDFGKNNIDEAYYDSNNNLNIEELLLALNKKDIVCGIDFFNEASKYIYFVCLRKGKMYQVLFDKKKDIPYVFNQQSFPHSISNVLQPYICSDNDCFISVLYPNQFDSIKINRVQDNKGKMLFSNLYSTIDGMSLSDNPVLLLFFFKK